MVVGGTQQRLSLPATPESARSARRFVSDVLSAARADAFADTATLLTSELVTNVIVHAHTDLQVRVEATATWVRVEVADGDSRMPARRGYAEDATTGRGLEMLELLADDHGVEPLADEGKLAWFRLGVVPGTPVDESVTGHGAGIPQLTTTIRLVDLPVPLYCAWQQHADALLREAMLAAFDEDNPEAHGDFALAGRALSAMADAFSDVFAMRDDDVASADVPLDIDTSAVPWFPILREQLSRATAMSVAGQLLVPPSLPEIVAVRNWMCDEVARQAAGLSPTPWVQLEGDEPPVAYLSTEVLDEVRDAKTALVAADAANRIVAVSASAAELLGWESAADLEGRRLVTIIPRRLRDRHIAGFTRHLVDGSSRIIGTPVQVPALRHDGSEVEVELLIERRSHSGTRGLFVATLAPATGQAG